MEIDLSKKIRELLDSQRFAVLATNQDGQPYASLVAFLFSEDLRQLFFATIRASRKFTNLQNDPRVSLLIDSRSNGHVDFREAEAVTAFGQVRELVGLERQEVVTAYRERHPYLQGFVEDPDCALLQVTVGKYALVNQFQNVMELAFES